MLCYNIKIIQFEIKVTTFLCIFEFTSSITSNSSINISNSYVLLQFLSLKGIMKSPITRKLSIVIRNIT